VGLAVNQSIQLYRKYGNGSVSEYSDVRPLLWTLIEDECVNYREEKVRMLLGAGADVSVRVRCREYDSVLDREGVSVLERTRRRVCQYSDSENKHDRDFRAAEYMKLTCEIKKYVRRHSV
jgi:hypothetical protein